MMGKWVETASDRRCRSVLGVALGDLSNRKNILEHSGQLIAFFLAEAAKDGWKMTQQEATFEMANPAGWEIGVDKWTAAALAWRIMWDRAPSPDDSDAVE